MKYWRDCEVASRRTPLRKNVFKAALLLLLFGVPAFLIRSDYPLLNHPALPWRLGDGAQLSTDFQWDSIQASEDLQFHPCFDGFECAKLKLPLDYFNGTHPKSSISLALAKLPARVPIDDPRYAGPVLVNPGGPGGSGVGLALGAAHALQVLIDPANAKTDFEYVDESPKYYDIIGFDPRGVGRTEPGAFCIPDGPARWSWKLREAAEGVLGSSDAALGRLWSMGHAYGKFCKQTGESHDGPDIMQYMTTASVARDMLEVAEKHAEYIQKKLSQKSKQSEHSSSFTNADKESVKLQYFGFSYGTFLGYTFASMFPDRVGKMILDGVVNAEDYTQNLGNGSLHDTEKAMTSFYTYCSHVGPEECPLATPNSTPADIETRFHKIMDSIYHNPVAVNSETGPEIISYSDIKRALFTSLYSPSVGFPILAQILYALEKGSGEALDNWAGGMQDEHVYQCSLNATIPVPDFLDAELAILCSDGVDVSDQDIHDFEEYWKTLEKISPTAGPIWSMLRLQCASWKTRAVYRFEGPFGGNTSNPILFISNTADPVTPLRSGRIMHASFPGSGHLVQDSAGHCTFSFATLCTWNRIRTYFQAGKLPPPGLVCIPPQSPFSLNSTDPGSPFYEPSLGQSSDLFDVRHWPCNEWRTMDATRHLQHWFAREHPFSMGHDSLRAKGLRNLIKEKPGECDWAHQ